MTDFAQKLKDHNLTIAEFCRLSGTGRKTVESWYYGVRRDGIAPDWVDKMLEMHIKNTTPRN